MKKVAILQSNYIPWRGYFDLINYVDEFIIYDDVQYTKRDWRNRNLIKTKNGLIWLTIPVEVKGNYFQKIKDTKIVDNFWQIKHLKSLKFNYSKSRYYDLILSLFEPVYKKQAFKYLTDCNLFFLKKINKFLDINTKISLSSQYILEKDKNDRLISLLRQTGGTTYISGEKAKNYINPKLFEENKIKLEWYNYNHLTKYNQLWGNFENFVSIIDLLMNEGPNAKLFLGGFSNKT